MKKKQSPVADPVRDAEKRTGCTWIRKKTVSPWEPWITHCTTGQFARLDEGYTRHCGPTAITNLILTLYNRYGSPVNGKCGPAAEPGEDSGVLVPAEVFQTVSQIGQRKKIYWNTDVFGHFGGTYDFLTEVYIRTCLRQFGIPSGKGQQDSGPHRVTVRWHGLPSETQIIRALEAGKLLYLQLYLHPCYGTHHLLCYGYTNLHNAETGERELYLLLADGWSRRPRYMRMKGRGICNFFAIA